MSSDEPSQAMETGQVPVATGGRVPAVRHEGAIALAAIAMGALALGAVAVGALTIGRLAIGRLAMGRVRLRSGQVDDLRIVRLTVGELRVEQIAGKRQE